MYPQVFGKYVLERELSRGGMARVLLATLRGAGGFEKRLVVKQIRDELSFDQQFVRRFVEEAKTTVALSHPNIVPVYELGVEQGTYFLAMELVEGCSIAEVVREQNADGRRRVLSPEEGAYVGMEVCRALDYAHRRMKVVHRDITPRNVMIDEEGQVKLIDFGIAAPALVAGHEILGSPGHMPPEQVAGKELGPATDIFAVAVLLMEGWSGVAPFRRPTPEGCDRAMREPHPKPSDYGPRLVPLDDVIVRAMQLDPKARQQDATELGRALRAFLQGTDVTDIARALGDRVREQREMQSEPEPRSSDGTGKRPPNPSVSDMGTQTFAARDETMHWSSPTPGELEPPGASTRRLDLSEPPPPSEATPRPFTATDRDPDSDDVLARAARKAAAYARSSDPRLTIPTPLMIEPVGKGSDLLRTARAAQDAARASHDAERTPLTHERVMGSRADTLATRGLETPVRGTRPSQPPAPRSRLTAVVVLAALIAVGGGVAWRSRVPARSDPGRQQSATSASVAVSAVPSAGPPEPASAALSIAAPLVSPPPSARAAAAPSATDKGGKALVSFLGDPGTRVSIDGSSRGMTPVRVNLEPGSHDVRFQFDPTGESRGERFSVKANERVTVRAEFTGATPTVKIRR